MIFPVASSSIDNDTLNAKLGSFVVLSADAYRIIVLHYYRKKNKKPAYFAIDICPSSNVTERLTEEGFYFRGIKYDRDPEESWFLPSKSTREEWIRIYNEAAEAVCPFSFNPALPTSRYTIAPTVD